MLVFIFFLTTILIYISYKKYNIILNPFVFESYYTLLFLVVPQIILPYFIPTIKENLYSNIMIILYIVGVFIGTESKLKAFKLREIENRKFTGHVNIIIGFLLLFPTLSILSTCGLSISGVRCYYETVVFSKFASFYELGKTFLLLGVIILIIAYKKLNLYIFIILFFIIFSGSKFAIFNLLLFLLLFFEVYKNLKPKKILLYSIPILLLLIFYHFAQTVRAEENPFITALKYFDIYEKQSFLADELNRSDRDFYYGKIFFTSFYKFIPRIIWESKPYAYGFAILNWDIFPEFAAANYMPSFGLGSIYADFGFVGVFFFGIINGFFRKYSYQVFLKSNKNSISTILYYFGLSILTVGYLFVEFYIASFLTKTKTTKV
jgi:hypothetical protein